MSDQKTIVYKGFKMARTSNVSDNQVIAAAILAKKNGWTVKETAVNSKLGLEPAAFRGRITSISKKLEKGMSEMTPEQQEKASQVISLFKTAFVDGRGRTGGNVTDLFESVDFDALNALDEDTPNQGVEA